MGRLISSFCIFLLIFSSCQNNRKSLVLGKIKRASDLATTQFTINKLVYGTKEKKLFWVIDLESSRFLARSKAIVKAGIDISELQMNDVKIEKNSISLILPHVRVLSFSYPAELFEEIDDYSEDFLFNPINVKEKEGYFRDAEIDIRNSLKYMDIEKTTKEKTRLLFEAMLKNMGFTEIYIDFKEGDLIREVNISEIQ